MYDDVCVGYLTLQLLFFNIVLYVRTGPLKNGCSFEDDLSLGAEGQ